ncbi:hypothetical protein [Spiroplasma endosymbiont of Aspidapion aeneum]|uniref:hypothetical protein n=1 Tax=Spiroplasma endosymbiont of Aspidapion aeneum TaxID=3066276 RepID=UPI00313C638F
MNEKKYCLAKTFTIYKLKNIVILNKGTNQKIISLDSWNKNKKIFEWIFNSKSISLGEIDLMCEKMLIDIEIKNYINTKAVLIDSVMMKIQV